MNNRLVLLLSLNLIIEEHRPKYRERDNVFERTPLSKFFFCFWRPILLTTHFHALIMVTSYIIHFISSLHLSSWPAAWVTFNEDELQLPLFLAATRFFLNASCYYVLPRRLSCFSLSSTSFKSSLLFTLKSLGWRLTSALVPRIDGRSFCGHAFVCFQIRLVFLARLMVVRFDFWVGGKFRSLNLPI